MNIIHLPIFILDNIFEFLLDTNSYKNCRITCKSFYYLMPTIKRYFEDGMLSELFVYKNNLLNGYHIKWFKTGIIKKICYYLNSNKDNFYFEYYSTSNPKKIIK